MKKFFLIAFAFLKRAQLLLAQNSKSEAKPASQPKQIPVKMVAKPVPISKSKEATATQAPKDAPNKEATTNAKPTKPAESATTQKGKPVMKKDGTPDKRYKENQNLKKDGTPDKRYKENKPTDSKK